MQKNGDQLGNSQTSENTILTLKISLLNTKPSIWRRLDCPVSFTLGDLHAVIQIAMGWEDSHLHAFQVGAVTYGMMMSDDEIDEEDENAVTLASLNLDKPKSKILTFF